jgi:hypothetical protein
MKAGMPVEKLVGSMTPWANYSWIAFLIVSLFFGMIRKAFESVNWDCLVHARFCAPQDH